MTTEGAAMKRRQGVGQPDYTKRSRDESGVALMIVMGIILMLSLGTAVMAQNVIAHGPIVQQDLVQHEAYRAMQSGIDEYLYEANANPNYVMCNNADVYTGYPSANPATWTDTGHATLSPGLCSGLVLTQWGQVADLAATGDVAAWFTYGTPGIYECNNSSHCTSSDTWEQIQVVGYATSEGQKAFQQATIVIQPRNNFLLSLWWLNYDQSDPSTLAGDPGCAWYWAGSPPGTPANSLVSGCQAIDLITGETISGNMWVNDNVFICGNPTINGTIDTVGGLIADPQHGGCTQGVPAANWVKEAQTETAPTDDAVLGSVAQQNGCLYEGPTEIDLLSTGGYDVYSPDTPTTGTGPTPTDNLNVGTTSDCVPSGGWGTDGGAVTGPTNGVVFVQGCSPACNATGYAPLGTALANSVYEPDTSGESVGTQEGDAIVEGVDKAPLTIGAADNVIIDGDICYQSWTNCTTAPTAPGTADVVALVAYNFVEVNHPMTTSHGNWVNDGPCPGTSPSQFVTWGNSVNCDLTNPIIDAAILALNHQFDAHNFDQGAALGNISIEGAISEDWRGPVGTSGGGGGTGYAKQYTYDSRLNYLSPPDYLNPGTSSWGLAAIAATTGGCPAGLPTWPLPASGTACQNLP
jgi:hypothetical protein